MNELKLPLIVSLALLAPAAWSQTVPDGPVGALQAQVGQLANRVAALEAAAPNPSVDGRTYCFVLDLEDMRGFGFNQTERSFSSIIRRQVTFNNGAFQGSLLSHNRNTLDDNGVVTPSHGNSDPMRGGIYQQSGNRLDLTFDDLSTVTWYVSRDGSLISGTSQSFIDVGGPGQITIGQTRQWTLVENDSCYADPL